MDQPSKVKIPGKPRILVAPLDWGLGHATRCIPVIRELLKQGAEPWLAGENAQEALLRNEFPELPLLQLEGYRVKYARSRAGLLRKMIMQAPRILKCIRRENAWLNEAVRKFDFDAVISDNRYGLYHEKIPSVFMTHQLLIKSPGGNWVMNAIRQRNYRYINRFTECWVPDEAGNNSLAGVLSHPEKKPAVPVHYIGWLSRFEKTDIEPGSGHLLVILSGPEPQRSIFEDIIIKEISHYNGTATIVRGLPASLNVIPSTSMLRFYNHLSSAELNKEISEAEFVIARSGYSTIMDMVKMRKKTILLPTPGQTEQEWLSKWLMEKQIACCLRQYQFTLEQALTAARQFNYHIPEFHSGLLENNITRLLSSLRKQ